MSVKILLADDCQRAIFYEQLLFNGFDVEFYTVSSGIELLEIARKIVPDIVIAAANLPKTDGIECCRQIKKDSNLYHLPIIITTPRGSDELMQLALDAGCASYMAKPLNKQLVLSTIRRLGINLD